MVADLIVVEVAFALPDEQVILSMNVEAGTTIREAIDGHKPVAVTYPECVSVYKRGELDDAAMMGR